MPIITYWKHSGFSVRTENHTLIFDYLPARMPPPRPEDRAIAFISHAHRDHFSDDVTAWWRSGVARLVVSDDLPKKLGDVRLKPGERASLGGVEIAAFGSTDQGVSFWAEADGVRVFHAGDFNFWHWRAESTQEEIDEAERAFEAILDSLKGLPVDITLFPVDPRMGEGLGEGALRFAEVIRPQWLIPMHWWDDASTAIAFANKSMPEGVRALALTEPGQPVEIEIERGE